MIGIVRKSFGMIIGGAGLALGCASVSNVEATRETPAAPAPVTQGSGVTQLYENNCAKCHGSRGEGGGGGTRSFLTKEKFDQNKDKPYFDAIKKGVPDMGMDAYGVSLTDEQIWGLVVHIRELQGKALREEFGSPKPDPSGVFHSQRHNFKIETVVDRGKGLRTPWAVDWLPDGRMLVTSRPGTLHIASGGNLTEVQDVPQSVEQGQGGLMEVAVHPNYRENGWIYLALADPAKSGRGAMTKIVRGKLTTSGGAVRWTGTQTIFEADQQFYNGAGIHFGSRIVFDGKGHIFFVVGERGGNMKAQELSNPYGKIYRVNEDGSFPADNPFAKNASEGKHVGGIWTLGHRNPQGLVQDLSGNLWDTEHGPRGGDEVNLIQKGGNYGWPVIAFSINYNDAPFRTPWAKSGQTFNMPAFRWLPSIGACGLDVARGSAFPNWKGDLLAAGLVGQNLDRFRMKDGKMVEREELIHGMGRIRDVSVGPDGYVYVTLNEPDKIIRLVPAK